MKKINIKLNILILSLVFVCSTSLVQAADITEQRVINLVNEARFKAGVLTLLENQKLDQIANLKVQDMLDNKYFAHTSPSGITPWDWFDKVGYDYQYAGENLAIDFVSSEAQQNAWMKSETHRKNILNDKFTEIGVAVAAGEIEDHQSIITVQVFAAPRKKILLQQEFLGGSTRKTFSEDDLKGTVLAVKSSNDSGNNLFSFKNISDFLWILILLCAFSVLVISPLHLVEKSYEEVLVSLGKKLKNKASRFTFPHWLKMIFRSKSHNQKTEEIKSIKIRI